MKIPLKKTAFLVLALIASGVAVAHPGIHSDAGTSGIGHLLMEHGYLLAVIACGVIAVILRRSRRA